MTLLREIQDAASSDGTRVTSLLRRCKILAARLQSAELAAWVDLELNGYESGEDLPEYRKFGYAEVKGDFFGAFGRAANNVPIPIMNLGPTLWQDYMGLRLKQGVGAYEDLVFGNDRSIFQRNIPADFVVRFADQVMDGMTCLQAWQEIPRGTVVTVLDAVRNKILGFALDIEKENPQAGEADVSSNEAPVPPPVVQQVFNQNFHGSVGNVASGSRDFAQAATVNHQSINLDLVKLMAELPLLRTALLDKADSPDDYTTISAVRQAEVEAEKGDTPKLLESLAKAGKWALTTATSIGTTVAADAIKKSLGMP